MPTNLRETLAAKVRELACPRGQPLPHHTAVLQKEAYRAGYANGCKYVQSVAAQLIAESPELADLEASNAKLVEACEAALRIKKLWLPPPPSKCLPEHENEAVALIAMHDKLTAALAGEGERE